MIFANLLIAAGAAIVAGAIMRPIDKHAVWIIAAVTFVAVFASLTMVDAA